MTVRICSFWIEELVRSLHSSRPPDVRFGSKADIGALVYVRLLSLVTCFEFFISGLTSNAWPNPRT
jgi:hypothetical protein